MEIQEDLTQLDEDVTAFGVDLKELEGDVNFLFEETIIQDERLLSRNRKMTSLMTNWRVSFLCDFMFILS